MYAMWGWHSGAIQAQGTASLREVLCADTNSTSQGSASFSFPHFVCWAPFSISVQLFKTL